MSEPSPKRRKVYHPVPVHPVPRGGYTESYISSTPSTKDGHMSIDPSTTYTNLHSFPMSTSMERSTDLARKPNFVTNNGTIVDNSNGTVTPVNAPARQLTPARPHTPIHHMGVHPDDMMDIEASGCPCGHLHGPGETQSHDMNAVGLSNIPLLRGPD